MSSFVEALVLLLIGVGLTGLLLPFITRQWQQQQKAIEIKFELIEEIAELGTEMLLQVVKPAALNLFAEEEGAETDLASKLFDWVVRSQVIASRLKLYFGDALSLRWNLVSDLHQKFIMVSATEDGGVRAAALQGLEKALGDEVAKLIDWEAYSLNKPEAASLQQKAAYLKAEGALVMIIRRMREDLAELILQSRTYGEFRLGDWFGL